MEKQMEKEMENKEDDDYSYVYYSAESLDDDEVDLFQKKWEERQRAQKASIVFFFVSWYWILFLTFKEKLKTTIAMIVLGLLVVFLGWYFLM